jgi:Uma2 family endonuclease
MPMTTLLMLGPADQDRALTWEEFATARYQEGYQYEIIDGRLYVSPVPNLPQNDLEEWVGDELKGYRRRHPEVINYVSHKARVFVPSRPELTAPEPDVAAYHGYPLDQPVGSVQWEDVSPVLVVEVISAEDPNKDLVRNVELYREVPSIREYWIVDPRPNADRPTLLVYRRRGRRWQRVIEVGFGETYTTRLLPDFSLLVNPRP